MPPFIIRTNTVFCIQGIKSQHRVINTCILTADPAVSPETDVTGDHSLEGRMFHFTKNMFPQIFYPSSGYLLAFPVVGTKMGRKDPSWGNVETIKTNQKHPS